MTDTQPQPDVVDVLTTDHREFIELFEEIWATDAPERRRDLADTLISEVVRHAVAEEAYVYPAMREHLPDGEAAVRHDLEEHQELERTMKDLEDLDAADPRFTERARDLEATLRHHAQDEETDQFPKLRENVPRDTLVDLARSVERAKKLAPTRPHPSAPDSPVFHKLVGPGVGLVDRLRDRLSGRSPDMRRLDATREGDGYRLVSDDLRDANLEVASERDVTFPAVWVDGVRIYAVEVWVDDGLVATVPPRSDDVDASFEEHERRRGAPA